MSMLLFLNFSKTYNASMCSKGQNKNYTTTTKIEYMFGPHRGPLTHL